MSSLCTPFLVLLALATFFKNLLTNHRTSFTGTHRVNVLLPGHKHASPAKHREPV